jgi:HD-GYP domain-containing protein (c-di-GMP phosphodiesterase class II)
MTRRYNLKVSDFARTMARAVDAAEGKRLGHARLVSHLAWLLAAEEGLSPEDGQVLLLAGLFHDLGWILLAPELARCGAEPEFLARHPLDGRPAAHDLDFLVAEHGLLAGDFLRPLGLPSAVGEVLALAHESWDGSGVPDGLAGSEIPDTALILAVADHAISLLDGALEASSPPSEGLGALSQYSGRALDPELVETAQDLLGSDEVWQRLTQLGHYEPLLDEALYPVLGDFIGLDSPQLMQWAELLGDLADRYHPMVPEHSRKVRRLAGAVAREMGLTEEEAREIEVAACLAEIGRVGLPAPLVFRLGAFSEDERELLKAYPTVGERILEPMKAARSIYDAAITHREKLNGTGYPQGLVGDEIPLSGRILAVADTFVALTEHNPNRPGYSHSIALRILQGEETKLFDGLVADALEAVVTAGRGLTH